MKRLLSLFALFGFLAAVNQAPAAGLIIVQDPSWWPGPGPIPPRPIPPPWPPPRHPPAPRPYVFAPLEVNWVKVQSRINDQVAVTSVEQEFYNQNATRLEGTFVFPFPRGAHLDKFSMEIDGKQVEAELLPAEKARGIYEDIVRKLKDPALLEYAGRDMFKVRIFPIEPHSTKKIALSYTQLLKADSGLVNYTLPLSTEKFSAKPIKTVSVKVDLATRRPLKSIYSPSHKVEVKRDGPNRATAGYEASDVQPDSDFTLYFAPEKDDLGVNLLTHKRSGEDGYFLLLTSPGVDVKQRSVIPKDVAFVLDTSGSMAGKKLEQAKKALQFCVENLNDGDRFEVIRFSTEVEPLFEKLVDAAKENRARAEEFVQGLKAIGATAIDDALKKALALRPDKDSASRPFVVIFLTDGRPTIGTTDEEQILADVRKANTGRTRVFCFGIGTDVNTHLLDKITEETRAFSQYVLPEEDLEVKLSSFYSKIKEPVLANPVLRFTGDVRTARLYPSPLPDLFKGEQLVLVGRYSGQGDSAVIIEGSVNGSDKKYTYETGFPQQNEDNEFIPRLWATRRVGYLLDEIRLHGENSELKDEATELARKYGIVTPYTAYLIVEDESRRNVPQTVRLMQNFDRDPEARREAAQTWHNFQSTSSGNAAVADAQYGLALKSADAPAAAQADGMAAFRRRYGATGGLAPNQAGVGGLPQASMAPATESQARVVQYSQQTRFVAGKTFFQNEKGWIDSAIQKLPDAQRVRIQFGSPEYFELLKKHPETAPWLALGQNVQFALDKVVYEIFGGTD
ncbi:MAG TPA: VIT domain-containing protein [Verrucomicrobiae bacterium]